MKMKKIEIRKNCKICGNPLPKRFRIYCSSTCRNKEYGKKYSNYRKKYARDSRGKAPDIAGTKIQCPICDKWYVQLGTHVIKRHEYETAREFREDYGLDIKKGTVPAWYREFKGKQALENKTWENLKVGEKFRFKKGDHKVGVYKRSKQTLERLSNNRLAGRFKTV